jgi:hypothetical protein
LFRVSRKEIILHIGFQNNIIPALVEMGVIKQRPNRTAHEIEININHSIFDILPQQTKAKRA